MTKTAFSSVRIPPDMREQLRKVANDNGRYLSQQILHYIKQGLEREGKKS